MVTDLRKAAQMALEALEIASRNGSDGLKRYELKELDDTIAELHAALAQPEQTAMPPDIAKVLFDNVESLYVEDAQPEQEPVMFNGLTEEETNASASVRGLTPPKRKPLTEEQIAQIDWKDGETLHDFARAIEKAHGIE